jgi:hypothetical protein
MQSSTTKTIRGLSIAFILLLLSTSLNAQIKIKSRVEINPDSMQSQQSPIGRLKKTLDETDFWILPRSGTLELDYCIYTDENPLPENSYIVVTVGSKIYHCNMFPYLKVTPWQTDYSSHCLPCEPTHTNYDYYPDSSSQRILFMGHANDTVRVSSYTSEGHNLTLDFYGNGCSFYFCKPIIEVPCLCNDPDNAWKYPSISEVLYGGLVYRNEIMLGESKYIQAAWSEEYQQVYWASDWTDTPNHVGDERSDVTFSVKPLNGSKCGVYWEQINAKGELDKNGDMIRIIGRYWEKDSTFAVQVTAKCNGTTNTYWPPIYTMAPDRLGDIHNRARDVFDREFNIDDSCIVYGGKYGIPPHFLKAQISVESAKKTFTFNDGNKTGFAPSYRYEPLTEQFNVQTKKWKKNPFYVLPNSLREPPPPDHKHVLYMDYIKGSPLKVWYFIENYSQLVNPSNSNSYGTRKSDGRMDFVTDLGYTTAQAYFDTMYNYYRDPKGGSLGLPTILSVSEAADSTRKALIDFFKTRWHGGLDSMIAQTRIAASYGSFQALYNTALGRNYPEDNTHLPENLNVPGIYFPLSVEYQAYLMKSKLKEKFISGGNWPLGFEESFRKYIYYPKWNRRKAYPDDVFNRIPNYLPQNKVK